MRLKDRIRHAKALRWIWRRRFVDGGGYGTIAAELHAAGHRTPDGENWTARGVSRAVVRMRQALQECAQSVPREAAEPGEIDG